MTDLPPGDPSSLAALRGQYARLLQRLEANEREFRRLARSVWRVQEDERRRIARELHDGVGQNLTALKHRIAQLGTGLPPGDATRERIDAALALCSDTLEDTRQLSRLLRPPVLDDLGLEAALRWLVRSQGEASGIAATLKVGPLPVLTDELQTLLFRVAQEALANVARHARAGTVLVRLVAGGGQLQLQVVDDGIGHDPAAAGSGGSGLAGMRERLRLHGGRLELHSSPGNGTRVRAVLPLDAD